MATRGFMLAARGPGVGCVVILFLALFSVSAIGATRQALLVGVGTYKHAGPNLRNLEGPPHDVSALKQVLRSRWGYSDIIWLVDEEASKEAIVKVLAQMASELGEGDHLLFYFSGHGTGPVATSLPLPHTSGALFAYDSRIEGTPDEVLSSLLVGRHDLRPHLERLDERGVAVTVILDACFAENSSRTGATDVTRMATPFIVGDAGVWGGDTVQYERYPYRNVVTMTASAAVEAAKDLSGTALQRYPTLDGKPHGAFSDALLRALSDGDFAHFGRLDKNRDETLSVQELFNGIRSFMASRSYTHTPKLLIPPDSESVRLRPVLSSDSAPASREHYAPEPLRVQLSGSAVELEPRLSGLVSLVVTDENPHLVIRMTASDSAGVYAVEDPHGLLVGRFNALEPMFEALRRRAWLKNRVQQALQRSQATVSVDLDHPAITDRMPLGSKQHPVEANLTLHISVSGYPLVLDLFGDGTVNTLWPHGESERVRLWRAGEEASLFCVSSQPPVGLDTVYAFLLKEPIAADLLGSIRSMDLAAGAKFDLLSDLLSGEGVAGANVFSVEIYLPQNGEDRRWQGGCKSQEV